MIRAAAWTLALALPVHALQSGSGPIDGTLAVDINQSPATTFGSSDPFYLGTLGSEAWFTALNDSGLRGVYRTDGTPSGTSNAQAGQAGPFVTEVAASVTLPSGRILARGLVGDAGYELVGMGAGYDGVELIADIDPSSTASPFGGGSSSPYGLTEWNGEAWFYADDGTHGIELWRSDGTAAGTQLAFDLNPGPQGMANGSGNITVAGGKLFFNSTTPDFSLWVLDTPGGTPVELAKSFLTSPFSTVQMAEFGGGLLFDWNGNSSGRELWRSDGTPQGTVMVEDIAAGSGTSAPWFMGVDANRLWFSAYTQATGRELWSSDGTAAGTQLVAELRPGAPDGVPIAPGAPLNGDLVFMALDDQFQRVLWSSDGTSAGTAQLLDVDGNAVEIFLVEFVEWQGSIWFNGESPTAGAELYSTDGTSAGTAVADDIVPGTESSDLRVLGSAPGFLFLGAEVGGDGYEPFAADGTQGGTQLLIDLVLDPINLGSNPNLIRRFRDKLIFRATTPEFGLELWSSDGTPEGTAMLADARPGAFSSNPVPLTEIDAGLLFSVLPAFTGQELWITDGSPEGTRQLGVFDDGFAAQGWSAQRLDDGLAYFYAPDQSGNEVWRTDGTPEGTVPVPGYTVIPPFSEANEALVQDGAWYFSTNADPAFGNELWRTDGTPGGTVPIGDLFPGPGSSAPRNFTPFGDVTVFVAYTADGTDELWRTDGTLAGTQPFTDIVPTGLLLGPTELTSLGDRIVFRVNDGVHGNEPWVTDGTETGTQMLADLNPGPDSSNSFYFERVGDEIYFWANFGPNEVALYRTDGTPQGTLLVEDDPGFGGGFGFGSDLTAIGDSVLFAADGPGVGKELWLSDGTSAGTRVVTDIAPGLKASNPFGMTVLGERLLFRASDFELGSELHGIDLTDLGTWSAVEVGLGCGAELAAVGSAAFGATLTFESVSSAPNAPAALFFDADLAFVGVGTNCQLHLGDPLLLAPLSTDAQGFAQTSLTIPSDPNLAGLPLRFQSLAFAPGGGFLGTFELSNALEVVAAP